MWNFEKTINYKKERITNNYYQRNNYRRYYNKKNNWYDMVTYNEDRKKNSKDITKTDGHGTEEERNT